MSESDRLRERAHQIDMAQNGFSLPWAKKHLSPLLRESADRIEALESLVRDMYAELCKSDFDRLDDFAIEKKRPRFEERMSKLGIEVEK